MDKLHAALIFFLIIGLLSSFLGYIDYLSQGNFCGYVAGSTGVFSCETVYSIDEAMIVDGIHLSEIAPVFFIMAVMVYGLYFVFERRVFFVTLTLLLAIGSAMVPYLVYLEVSVAKAFCLFCTIMHVSIIGSFTLSSYIIFRARAMGPL